MELDVSALKRVGVEMVASGLPYEFVLRAVALAREYEGVATLVRMWGAESDPAERDETVVAIQELIDDVDEAATSGRLSDCDEVDAEIAARAAWKRSLRARVEAAGGVCAVARRARIPQPSLSRMLVDGSEPRAGTLVRLAGALGVTVGELRAG